MDFEAHRDLQLLEAVHEDARVTQRGARDASWASPSGWPTSI